MKFLIKMLPVNTKGFVVFKLCVFKRLSKGNGFFLEKIGYYNTDPFCNFFFLNTQRLGFWLNKGAFLNFSVYKLLLKFIIKF